MPEGPECTRTARQVDRAVRGKSLVNINFISGRYVKSLPTGFANFYIALEEKHLPVKGVFNKGKFIWWEFGDLFPICYMYTTLGMSGNFKLQPSKHTRLALYFDDDTAVYYNDQRNFGTVKFVFDDKDHQKKLDSIGPDMLNNPCTLSTFLHIARSKPRWTLVKWLMDQSQISGVGNIYKSESLFLAGIRPDKLIEECTDEELEKLYHAVCQILSASYSTGGATIRNYSDLYNNHGQYTRFASNPNEIVAARGGHVMVYNQTQDIYGNPVVRVKLNDGRTTFWSPAVQH
jgi:formamidopyrimidine-DNA glycosylase